MATPSPAPITWVETHVDPGQVTAATLRFRFPVARLITGVIVVLPRGVVITSARIGNTLAVGSWIPLPGDRWYLKLVRPRLVPATAPMVLAFPGWRNPAAVGWLGGPNFLFLGLRGHVVQSWTAPPVLLRAHLAVGVGSQVAAGGPTMTWTVTSPVAVPVSTLTLDYPVELGDVAGVEVTGLGRVTASGSGGRLSVGTVNSWLLSAGQVITVRAAWPGLPPSVADVPLRVRLLSSSGTEFAVGEGRTPTGLEPAACGAYRTAGWVAAENLLPPAGPEGLNAQAVGGMPLAWASTTSAVCGDTVGLHVSSAFPYEIRAYRVGWYGGSGSRLVYRSGLYPGVVQPASVLVAGVNEVVTRWSTTASVSIGTGWPPGDYLIKIVNTRGSASFVPLTVRDDGSHAALLVQNAVLTWQAYDKFGGYSLYSGPGDSVADRSRAVSLDRPYAVTATGRQGADAFLTGEYPVVRLVERLGLDVAYWTDLDLQTRPWLLAQHRALVVAGHSEYWTQDMRTAVTVARDAGLSVAWFGANNVYWRGRVQPDQNGAMRELVVYRDALEDPVTSPDYVTTQFRAPPSNQPEQDLVGTQYECLDVDAAMTVTEPSSWIFSGTGVKAGDQFPHLILDEYDRHFTGSGTTPVELLAHSPLACAAHSPSATYSDMTYYTVASGAGVFATGTQGWIGALADQGVNAVFTPAEQQFVARVTTNVLTTFAAGSPPAAVPNS